MMHCLHVLSTEADFQSRRGAETLAANNGPGISSDLKTIGRGGTWRSVPCAVKGLNDAGALLVHAWDLPSLLAAALAGARKIIFSPSAVPTRRIAAWPRTIIRHRDVTLVCGSATAQRAWIRSGVPADRCQLIRPGIDPTQKMRRRDSKLRAALGFTENDHVILAVGESSRNARHDHSVWATSILHVLDPNQKLLLWGRGPSCGSAARLATSVGHSELCCVAERKLGRAVDFEELLPAAELALITADGPVAPLPISLCMAARLPIVATASPIVSELLEDQRNALFAPVATPRRIAQAIEDLRGSFALQRSLAERAVIDVSDRYSNADFIAQHAAIYNRAVDSAEASPVAWTSRPCWLGW